MTRLLPCAALALIALAAPASAHFQIVYNPDANPARPGELPLKMVFWHPFDNGHIMDMGEPEEFFVVHRGEKTDLSDSLKKITFKGVDSEGQAWEGVLPVRRNGDWCFLHGASRHIGGTTSLSPSLDDATASPRLGRLRSPAAYVARGPEETAVGRARSRERDDAGHRRRATTQASSRLFSQARHAKDTSHLVSRTLFASRSCGSDRQCASE